MSPAEARFMKRLNVRSDAQNIAVLAWFAAAVAFVVLCVVVGNAEHERSGAAQVERDTRELVRLCDDVSVHYTDACRGVR